MTARPGPRQSRPRSEAHYGPERGTTYLIHFERPFHHAGHYRGWTPRPVLQRFADHLAGRGSKLTAAVAAAGIGMKLSRVWPDTTRDFEDAIKHQGGARRMCPDCGAPCAPPRLATGRPRPDAERERRPLWELERDGTTSDGEPLPLARDYAEAGAYRAQYQVPDPAPDVLAEQAALDELARSWTGTKEEPVNLREMIGRVTDRRARAAERARQAERQAARDRAHDEADRLAREADQIDMRAGGRAAQPLPLTAERAARVRDYIGPDLVRGVREPGPVRGEPVALGPGPDGYQTAVSAGHVAQARAAAPGTAELQGADLDAEIDRRACQYAEPDDPGTGRAGYETDVTAPRWETTPAGIAWEEFSKARSQVEAARHRYRAAADAQQAALAAQHAGRGNSETVTAAMRDVREAREAIFYGDAAMSHAAFRLQEARQAEAAQRRDPEAPGYRTGRPFGEPEVEEPGPEPGPDAARWSPGIADPEAQAGQDLAKAAADHHRYLRAGRMAAAQAAMSGNAADREMEQRRLRFEMAARREAEHDAWLAAADMHRAADNETGTPDHLYGAPECDEPDPETAHFGWDSPEAQDRGHWPLPRVLEPGEAGVRGAIAATLPDGTPHMDPRLATAGWQAQGGLYVQQQAQAEAG